jgi:hypothetical protein
MDNDMNRKHRRAAAAKGEFLIGINFTEQVCAMLGDKAEEMGASLMKLVMEKLLPQCRDETGQPSGEPYLFCVAPIIEGSKLQFNVRLDWPKKTALIGFATEWPAGAADNAMEVSAALEHAPRLDRKQLARVRELWLEREESLLRDARPQQVFHIADASDPERISMAPSTTDYSWLDSVYRSGFDPAGPNGATFYRLATAPRHRYYSVFRRRDSGEIVLLITDLPPVEHDA